MSEVMKKVRIGVFGGYRGFTMIDQLLHRDDAELVAVCDKYRPLLDNVKNEADKYGINVALYESFDEFIGHDMDAVVLANYANEHAVFAIKCLNAGKHVMSEVLPCATMAQAVELIEAVEKTGLVYSYAENYCYMKPTFEMWKRYQSGDVGEIMYGEGEYIHDCSGIWPSITYGEKNHWRNTMPPTFYCTHSLGPLLTITGLRPVSVVGFETNRNDSEKERRIANCGCAGLEMVTLENGAVLKSIHGHLKREPGSVNYQVYGKKGMMESARYNSAEFNIYKEGAKLCQGDWENYDPQNDIGKECAYHSEGHGGSDFYTLHFFIKKILGEPEGKWSIDVYRAVDMGICGLLAYDSILAGNISIKVPNLRNPEEREAWRNVRRSTFVSDDVDEVLPMSSHELPEFSDEDYAFVRELWQKGEII